MWRSGRRSRRLVGNQRPTVRRKSSGSVCGGGVGVDALTSYEEVEALGEGTFAAVVCARHKPSDRLVVLKKISKALVHTKGLNLHKEVAALEAIRPFCGTYLPCLQETFEDERTFYVATDHVPGYVTLHDYWQQHPQTSTVCATIIRNLLDAVKHIHRHGMAHRDLKPENVLVHPTTGAVRLIDFGITCFDAGCVVPDQSGTPLYMPPEVYLHPPVHTATTKTSGSLQWSLKQAQQSDLWALGMMLLECAQRQHVFFVWQQEYLRHLPPTDDLHRLSTTTDRLYEAFRRFLRQWTFGTTASTTTTGNTHPVAVFERQAVERLQAMGVSSALIRRLLHPDRHQRSLDEK